MSYNLNLIAPSSIGGFVFTNSATGNSYTADQYGNLKNVASNDVGSALSIGCTINNPAPIANFRNLLDGGDLTINPFQRGTSFTNIAGTLSYTADRWFAVGNASSAINVAQSSISSIPGFQYGLLFTRASSNSSVVPIYMGQVLESADCYRAQGQQVTLSFYAQAGANFSQVSSALTVLLNSGTSSNQSASSMMASSWGGFTSIINSSVVINSSGMARYQVSGTVPNNSTQLGVQIGFAGVSSAGATDGFIIAGIQLEIGGAASIFEHRDIQVELEIAQRYAWQLNEPSSGVAVAAGFFPTSSTQIYFLPLPVQMRTAPTVTISSGSWKATSGSSTSSGTISSGTTHTNNGLTINFNATGGTQGQGSLLQGGGGTGWILASADF